MGVGLLELILYIAVVGLIVWLITTYVPMLTPFATVITVIAVLVVLRLVLWAIGFTDLPVPPMRRGALPVAVTCKSCGAPLIWVTMRSGKPMPCEAARVTLIVADDRHEQGVAVTGHVSHLATCPQAAEHRT